MVIDLIKNYPVGLPKLNIFCCGGGYTLTDLMQIPGASRVLYGISALYDELNTRNTLGGNFGLPDKIVSDGFVTYALKNLDKIAPDTINIVCTSAYISNRFRRGDNHSLYGIKYRDKILTNHLIFEKDSEESYNKLVQWNILSKRMGMEMKTRNAIISSTKDFVHEITKNSVS